MHLGPAQLLVAGLLAGRHLDQRRPAEEDLGVVPDHHRVVAHPGHVGAAGGRVAEDDRERRDPRRGEAGQIAEHLAAGDEDVQLGRQVGAPGLDQADHRQPVLAGDLVGPQDLLERERVRGAAADGRVVGGDHALDALDDPDPGHDAAADPEVAAVADERLQLEERAVAIDQQLDPLAREQLAALAVTGDVLLAPAPTDVVEHAVELVEAGDHRLAVGGEDVRTGIDGGRGHRRSLGGQTPRDLWLLPIVTRSSWSSPPVPRPARAAVGPVRPALHEPHLAPGPPPGDVGHRP